MSRTLVDGGDLRQRTTKAVGWLLRPGPRVDGGFAAWYDAASGTLPYLYAEITGYLATLLCWLDERAAATAAGDWLVRTADPTTGGFRCLVPLDRTRFDAKQDLVFSLDTGVIVNGLANLHRITGDGRYRETAVRAADWLIGTAQLPDGSFRPAFDARRGEFAGESGEWSLRPGGYHAKVAAGLVNLAAVTGDERYADAASRACDAALGCQRPDGSFPAYDRGTHAHPHAYAAEGLWAVGRALQRDDCLDASVRATTWLLDRRNADGYVPRFVHDGVPTYAERIDVQAQALRLAAIHRAEGRLDAVAPDVLDRLTAIVLDHQADSTDPRIDGGFWFGRGSDGGALRHVNVWVTAFAVQAFEVLGGRSLDPGFLV